MRSLSILLLLPIVLAAPAAAQTRGMPNLGVDSKRCGPTVDRTRGPKLNGSTKLGDQPPAAQVLAVFFRDTDGCPAPVVLRQGIGANPDKARPISRDATTRPFR